MRTPAIHAYLSGAGDRFVGPFRTLMPLILADRENVAFQGTLAAGSRRRTSYHWSAVSAPTRFHSVRIEVPERLRSPQVRTACDAFVLACAGHSQEVQDASLQRLDGICAMLAACNGGDLVNSIHLRPATPEEPMAAFLSRRDGVQAEWSPGDDHPWADRLYRPVSLREPEAGVLELSLEGPGHHVMSRDYGAVDRMRDIAALPDAPRPAIPEKEWDAIF